MMARSMLLLEVPDEAWDWVSFQDNCVASRSVNIDLMKCAVLMKGYSKVLDFLGSASYVTYREEQGYSGPLADIRNNRQFLGHLNFGNALPLEGGLEPAFGMLVIPKYVSSKFICGVVHDGMMNCFGQAVNLGRVVEERFFSILTEDGPQTLISALMDTGYVIMADTALEVLYKDGTVNTLTFRVDQPEEVFRPIFTTEEHLCVLCGNLDRSCKCFDGLNISGEKKRNRSDMELKEIVGANHWKGYVDGLRSASTTGEDMWRRFRECWSDLAHNAFTLATVKATADARRWTGAPVSFTSFMKYELVTEGRLLEDELIHYVSSVIRTGPAPRALQCAQEKSILTGDFDVREDENGDFDFCVNFGQFETSQPLLGYEQNTDTSSGGGEFVSSVDSNLSNQLMEGLLGTVDEDLVPQEDSQFVQQNTSRENPMTTVVISERPACPICGATFARKYEIRRHIATVHEAVKKQVCTICNRAFSLRQHLNSHIEAVHNRKRDHNCPECGMAFATEAKVNRHVRCVHRRERTHKCSFCDGTYFQHSDLNRHIKRKHPEALSNWEAEPASSPGSDSLQETSGSDMSSPEFQSLLELTS